MDSGNYNYGDIYMDGGETGMIYGDPEIVRANGDLYAFIQVQNEYTGNVSGSFRRVYQNNEVGYYAKADGKNQCVNNAVLHFLRQEQQMKDIYKFYKNNLSSVYGSCVGGYTK